MQDQILKIIQASIDVKLQVLENKELQKTVGRSVEALVTAFKNGNKVLFCGNGGSAADAQHLAAEFSGRFLEFDLAWGKGKEDGRYEMQDAG